MKKLLFAAMLAVAVAALASCTQSDQLRPAATAGNPKWTAIHFTKNQDIGTYPEKYATACIGIVTTETLYADKGQEVRWKIKKNNGASQDEHCNDLVFTKVNLRFRFPKAFGTTGPIYADNNGEITATVSMNEADFNSTKRQKYQVFIDNDPAGPDPIIIVMCGGCGGGGGE